MPDGHGCCHQSTYHNQVHSAPCRREGGGISHHGKRAVGLSTAPDLWTLARSGSLSEVAVALAGFRRNGGNVNARNALGVTALHLAVWRNHVPIIRHLLGAGADPNIRDGESGWSSLHRALHFGHLAAAGVLIAAGASLTVEDSKGRTPLDLLSVPISHSSSLTAGTSSDNLLTEVYSWGSGLNYQLGTGTTGIQHVPGRLDSLQGLRVSNVAAAKFHSAALTTSGELYSWGFGRGGRLGHSDFHIHSGQTAVITPERVCAGLGSRRVVAVGTAKHHTIVATESGEVYTWGSNREGRLGYPSVDTQPTPRRVSALRVKVVAVAAANKHSIALTDSGEVFTWGCNREGQLGYGTSNSASNCVPRCVEFHASGKGKQIIAVAATAAKYHTVILSVEGDVFTWGYKMVIPKRVIVARDTRKGGVAPLKFHRAEKLHVMAIAAGVFHSTAITRDGCAFYWPSNNPSCVHQIWSLAGHEVVAVAAGKHRSAVASAMGAVYMWDASAADDVPHPVRIPGLRQAVDLTVGESHSVGICTLSIPSYTSIEHMEGEGDPVQRMDGPGEADSEGDFNFEDATEEGLSPGRKVPISSVRRELPSLKEICEEVIAKTMVEPKNVLLMLELADSLGAHNLKHYCEMLVMKNLDYILSISASVWGQARLSILADLERVLADYTAASEKWLNRHVPKPSGVPLSSLVLDEDDAGVECGPSSATASWPGAPVPSDCSISKSPRRQGTAFAFLHQCDGTPNAISTQLRTVRRKLQQIEALEIRQAKGMVLDAQQLEKVGRKEELLAELDYLEAGADPMVGGLKIGRSSATDSPPGGNVNDLEENGLELVAKTMQASAKKQKHRSRRKGKSALPNVSTFCSSEDVDSGSMEKYQQPGDTRCAQSDEVVRQLDFECDGDATCAASTRVPVLDMGDRAHCDGGRMACSSVCGTVAPAEMPPARSQSPTAAEPPATLLKPLKVLGRRKGGLSVFLKGELDALPAAPLPPPKPKAQGPAWGGLGLTNQLKGESLRTIQIEQGKGGAVFSEVLRGVVVPATPSPSSTGNNLPTIKDTEAGGGLGRLGKKGTCPMQSGLEDPDSGQHRIALSDFLKKKSAPIAIKAASTKARGGVARGKKGGPPDEGVLPWGRSPGGKSTPSLRDIQEQQERWSHHRSRCDAPVLRSPAAVPLGGTSPGGLPADPAPASRWYRPEEEREMPISTIRNIQTEEMAMKELRRKYSTVRLVTNATR